MIVVTSKRCINLGAAATASVVALGLVTVPPEHYESMTARNEVAAVQLRAAASTQIVALVDAVTPLPSSAAASPSEAAIVDPAPPRASATGGTDPLAAIATAALALAVTPLWYIAFPITLPLSVIGGITLGYLGRAVGGAFGSDPLTFGIIGAVLGLGAFVVGPLGFALGAIPSQFAAPASSRPPAASQRPINDSGTSALGEAPIPATADPKSASESERPTMATESDRVANKATRGETHRSGVIAQRVAASTAPQPGVETAEIETAPPGTAEAAVTAAPIDNPTAAPLTAESANPRFTTRKAEDSPTEQTARSTGNKRANVDPPSRQRDGKASAAGGSERGVGN